MGSVPVVFQRVCRSSRIPSGALWPLHHYLRCFASHATNGVYFGTTYVRELGLVSRWPTLPPTIDERGFPALCGCEGRSKIWESLQCASASLCGLLIIHRGAVFPPLLRYKSKRARSYSTPKTKNFGQAGMIGTQSPYCEQCGLR